MKPLKEILNSVASKEISIEQAEELIKIEYIDELDNMAHLDFKRHLRTGIPEVIFAESKTPEMVIEITKRMLQKTDYAIITRLKHEHFKKLEEIYKENDEFNSDFNKSARTAFITKKTYKIHKKEGSIGIITAGTSDIPIAEEASLLLKAMGIKIITSFDVGISGMHRIFPALKEMIINNVDVILVIAGMEGTLPGIVSALVDIPVIGVPTSSGYGIGEKGKGAITTMLQSCSPGLAVVNIDNGFGAAAFAAIILKRIYKFTSIH
ncbi:MAG: nickel pincer cofactor biosynthesis protein LarB [Promethearchaeota archaeon]